MPTSTVNRNLLDQLTASAAPPSVPTSLASALGSQDPATDVGGGALPPVFPAPINPPSQSTEELESRSASPEDMATRVAATKQAEQTEHPSFLTRLGRLAGGAAGIESPESSPQAKIGAAITRGLGGLGTAGALAVGTPAQKQAVLEQEKIPLEMQQLQSNLLYRNALGSAALQNATTKGQQADIAQQKANDTMRLKGYVPDPTAPGTFRAMSPQEILADPQLSQNQDMKSAAIAAHNAQAQLSDARQKALTNPDSLTQQNFLKSLEERERVAMAQLALAGRRLSMAQETQNRQNEEFRLNFGETAPGAATPTGQPAAPGQTPGSPGGLNLSNSPDMMLVNPSTGIPIPMKMLASLEPTKQEQNRAAFAASAMHSADKIQQLVSQAKKAQVGPFAGRTAELMAKAGLGDQFNQELQNYVRFTQSAATAAHTGRFSVPILEKMDKMIGPEMNPDQLSGAIDSIKGQMAPYADAGWKPTVWEYRAWLSGKGATPSGKTNLPPNWEGAGIYSFPDGSHRKVSENLASQLPSDAKKVK